MRKVIFGQYTIPLSYNSNVGESKLQKAVDHYIQMGILDKIKARQKFQQNTDEWSDKWVSNIVDIIEYIRQEISEI